MQKPKPKPAVKPEPPVVLYPPQPPAAVAAMEDEFAAFISDPARKARRIEELRGQPD
jgi:hypothetical protein